MFKEDGHRAIILLFLMVCPFSKLTVSLNYVSWSYEFTYTAAQCIHTYSKARWCDKLPAVFHIRQRPVANHFLYYVIITISTLDIANGISHINCILFINLHCSERMVYYYICAVNQPVEITSSGAKEIDNVSHCLLDIKPKAVSHMI